MIISKARKYVFVHIPKTGGTALTLALEGRAAKDDIIIGDTPKARQRRKRLADLTPAGRLWKHSTLADIDGVVSSAELDDMFCFTLVRNPWDRAVSLYHWLQAQTFDHPAVARAQSLSFSGFINHEATKAAFLTQPYHHYVTDAAGQVQCSLFARLEALETDLQPLWGHLGFVCAVDRVNASHRARDWRGYYSDADADVIASVCQNDITAFGYAFDPQG